MKFKDICQRKLYLILAMFLLWIVQEIGLIIGRYKLINMIGGELKIANVNTQIQKIFEMSGLLRLIPVEQKNKKEVQYD